MKSFEEYIDDGSVHVGTSKPPEARALRVQAKLKEKSPLAYARFTSQKHQAQLGPF